MFVITDGTRFLSANKTLVDSLTEAQLFVKKKKADTTLNLQTNLFPGATVQSVESFNAQPETLIKEQATSFDHLNKTDPQVATWLKSCITLSAEIEEDKKKTLAALAEVDMKISDVEHFLENRSFNAAEGYKLAKMISNLRKERRVIKIHLDKLECFNPCKLNELTTIAMTVKPQIEATDVCDAYAPRILTNLFNGEI